MARKITRVFLESNVILSGLISSKGAPRIILDILSLNLSFLVGLTGEYNLIEIERNVLKKLPQAVPVYKEYLSKLNLRTIPLPSKEDLIRFSGHVEPKDVPVLVSAINGEADFLVTGDKKHFEDLSHHSYPCKIVNPSEFLQILAGILE